MREWRGDPTVEGERIIRDTGNGGMWCYTGNNRLALWNVRPGQGFFSGYWFDVLTANPGVAQAHIFWEDRK